jgi:hypothetical protein
VSIRVVNINDLNLPEKGDCVDWLAAHANATAADIAALEMVDPNIVPMDTGHHAVAVNMGNVSPEPVRWLWPGKIALRKVTLIAGDPGLGK